LRPIDGARVKGSAEKVFGLKQIATWLGFRRVGLGVVVFDGLAIFNNRNSFPAAATLARRHFPTKASFVLDFT
jgi:hypothetical protein